MNVQLSELAGDQFELAAEWLSEVENSKWLEFAGRGQQLSSLNLRLMVQRNIHCLRLFETADSQEAIGIVGLSDISALCGSATLWYVLGNKSFSGSGVTTAAVNALLDYGFGELKLQSCQAWAVQENLASVRVLEKNRFQQVGTQRKCHYLDGQLVDRTLFDLLASEHEEHA